MDKISPRIIPIALPSTGDEEWQACRAPLASGWLTQGPRVAEFELAFAQRHRVPHAIATSSCTTGLHLILAAMRIGPGDEVILPSFTWIATANVVMYRGATPVFADVDRTTFNISPQSVAQKLTPRTRAVIVVHLFGLCADVDEIKSILPPHNPIFEDTACAAASYKKQPAGSLGLAAAFSFHPCKSMTTGEGGMVTTGDPQLAETVNVLRNHGAAISEEQRRHGPHPYLLPEFNLLGFNYRMTDLQAAVGLVQLGKLGGFITERAKWAAYYRKHLANISWLHLPQWPGDCEHAWQAYVTWVDPDSEPMPRNAIMDRLQQAGIATRPGTHAVHMLGYYRERFGLHPEACPSARDCDHNTMAIPLHNRMDAEDYAHVATMLRAI